MLELKKMFQSLYTWKLALNSLLVSNFFEFLEFCSSFLYLGFLLYFLHASVALCSLLMNLNYL